MLLALSSLRLRLRAESAAAHDLAARALAAAPRRAVEAIPPAEDDQ